MRGISYLITWEAFQKQVALHILEKMRKNEVSDLPLLWRF